jgi:SulP family sulfate permease
MLAAAFGNPCAGANERQIVNINAGGKTRISGAPCLFLLAVLLGLGFISSAYPTICFAGLIPIQFLQNY